MEETPKGGTIVARAAKIAAESGQPVEQVTRALMETTDVWKRFVEAQAENEKLRAQLDALKAAWKDDTNWPDFGLVAQRILFAPVQVELTD